MRKFQHSIRWATWIALFILVNTSVVHADLIGVVTDSDVEFISAECSTPLGSYQIEVDVAGERANIIAPVLQTNNLASDETLTINGIDLFLSAGLTSTGVRNRINDATAQTGVLADDVGGTTRLYSVEFGSAESISVVSNLASSSSTSGFGTILLSDAGADIGGSIGGVDGTGIGTQLVAMGITIRVNDPSLLLSTGDGDQGTVTLFQPVPEPSSLLTLMAAIALLANCRRRTRMAY